MLGEMWGAECTGKFAGCHLFSSEDAQQCATRSLEHPGTFLVFWTLLQGFLGVLRDGIFRWDQIFVVPYTMRRTRQECKDTIRNKNQKPVRLRKARTTRNKPSRYGLSEALSNNFLPWHAYIKDEQKAMAKRDGMAPIPCWCNPCWCLSCHLLAQLLLHHNCIWQELHWQ